MNEAITILLNARGAAATLGEKMHDHLNTAARCFIILLLVIAVPEFAFAQGGGTEQERAACAADVKRHCIKMIDQGDLVILSCLQENRSKLSPACNKVLVDHGQ